MIRIVIADDSAFFRQVLKDVLEKTGKVSVTGSAKNGKEAIEMVKNLKPDLLILDYAMPVMDGLEALRRVMVESPLPVFMFSALTRDGAAETIKALEYGALDFLLKPEHGTQDLEELVSELIGKIENIIIKYRIRYVREGKPSVKVFKTSSKALSQAQPRKIDIIAGGSSTGGVQAAACVIPFFSKNAKPIVWVQHMPQNFTKSFAIRLNSLSKVRVKEAGHGDVLEDGNCYIAPGGFQMRVEKFRHTYRLDVRLDERVSGFCPSCDVLFNSVGDHFTDNALGIILTGMGTDGTQGLLKMHNRGAYVIGQNEASCTVYGMPKSAHAAGAVDVELDVSEIAGYANKIAGLC